MNKQNEEDEVNYEPDAPAVPPKIPDSQMEKVNLEKFKIFLFDEPILTE